MLALRISLLAAVFIGAAGTPAGRRAQAPQGARQMRSKSGAQPSARYLPATSQLIRHRIHRGVATEELWNVVNVAAQALQPEGPAQPRQRPRIVRATGDDEEDTQVQFI